MASLYPLKFNEKLAFFYNTVAATLWFCCLGRFLILLPLVGENSYLVEWLISSCGFITTDN